MIVLAEWRDNASGRYIKERLESHGLFVATDCTTPSRSNALLVAANVAFETERITPDRSDKGALLLAHIPVNFRLLASYFPQGTLKAPFFRACLAQAANSGTVPFLLVGDLNTGCNDADIESGGMPFFCADLFEALRLEAGLVDLWRAEHGNRREWTWRSRVNGFRIDHAFANTAFIERFPSIRCSYDHEPRKIGLTDHSALFVTAGPQG